MQKKLLALAIAGAMAAPLAAQAQGSNVTIYGSLKPSIDFVDNGDESGVSVQSNNSLIGFKGSEDLGNGLKAIFQLESQLDFDERGDTDAGDGQWVRRDSWVGLSGGFGSVVIGNMFPAYKRSTDFADPFADSIGDYNNIVGSLANGADEFNTRFRNAVHYTSPNWGGFSLQATYGLRGDGDGDGFEDDSDDVEDDSFSVSGTYVWGPMTLTAAYEDQADSVGEGTKAFKIGAGYKFGNTTLAALYAKENFGDVGLDDDLEHDVFFASIKHAIGKIDLAASYTWADEFDAIEDSGAQAFAVGATYNLSKRTSIMALYALVKNDDASFYGFDSGYDPFVDADGEADDVSGFSVRLRHNF
ncbi:MAG TPA: porin [Burkholderiales bacterium]|nr:porin [Burkholderiales bacterium]